MCLLRSARQQWVGGAPSLPVGFTTTPHVQAWQLRCGLTPVHRGALGVWDVWCEL